MFVVLFCTKKEDLTFIICLLCEVILQAMYIHVCNWSSLTTTINALTSVSLALNTSGLDLLLSQLPLSFELVNFGGLRICVIVCCTSALHIIGF